MYRCAWDIIQSTMTCVYIAMSRQSSWWRQWLCRRRCRVQYASSTDSQSEVLPTWVALTFKLLNNVTFMLCLRPLPSADFPELAPTTILWKTATDDSSGGSYWKKEELIKKREWRKGLGRRETSRKIWKAKRALNQLLEYFGWRRNDEIDVTYVVVVKRLIYKLNNWSVKNMGHCSRVRDKIGIRDSWIVLTNWLYVTVKS